MSFSRKTVSFAAAAVMAVSGMYLPAVMSAPAFDTAITASAAQLAAPSLKSGSEFGDRLLLYINNYNSYSDSAVFTVRVSGRVVKRFTGKSLKSSSGKVSLTNNGKSYVKPYTRYTVKAAVSDNGSTVSSQIKLQTSCNSLYTVKSGSEYYTLSGGSMKSKGTLPATVCLGELCDAEGNAVKGRSIDIKAPYVHLAIPVKTRRNENNEQLYSYKMVYVKASDVSRKSMDSARNAVVNYAVKMSNASNQRYVLCGEEFTNYSLRSDCSGLTKLSYLQVGYYLEHIAEKQAEIKSSRMIFNNIERTGTTNGVDVYRVMNNSARVDTSKLMKGDLLFFLCNTNNQQTDPQYVSNGIGHVAMYIGDGKFVHFTSSYGVTNHPCRVENLRNYENTQLKVVRAVRIIY